MLAAIEAEVRTVCGGDGNPGGWSRGERAIDDRIAYSISDLVRLTSLSKQSIHDAINAQQLVARKLGRRTVILRADAESWLAGALAIHPASSGDNLRQLTPEETAAPRGAVDQFGVPPEPSGVARAPLSTTPRRDRGVE
jgi:hypothetical protein